MTDVIHTTLNQIRNRLWFCESECREICKALSDAGTYDGDTPVTFEQIYKSNGYNNTLSCLRATDPKWHPLWRHFACDCADDVRHLLTDPSSTSAIDVARRYADGLATDDELKAAWAAAHDAAHAAFRAIDRAAARATTHAAAHDAAWFAAQSAVAAAAAAVVAAVDESVAGDLASRNSALTADAAAAVREKQMERLFMYCRTGQRVPYVRIKVTK